MRFTLCRTVEPGAEPAWRARSCTPWQRTIQMLCALCTAPWGSACGWSAKTAGHPQAGTGWRGLCAARVKPTRSGSGGRGPGPGSFGLPVGTGPLPPAQRPGPRCARAHTSQMMTQGQAPRWCRPLPGRDPGSGAPTLQAGLQRPTHLRPAGTHTSQDPPLHLHRHGQVRPLQGLAYNPRHPAQCARPVQQLSLS